MATVFFLAMGYHWEPAQFTRDAGALVATGVNSLVASIE